VGEYTQAGSVSEAVESISLRNACCNLIVIVELPETMKESPLKKN
jgi:hypothetical protein